MVRVTFAGEDLERLPVRGFDQWFRLFLPREDGETDFGAVPQRFGMAGYLQYLRTDASTRPPFRNYTVRELRPEVSELDVDFVAHGDDGIAGPWAQRAHPGERIALIDQGRGFDPRDDADAVLLVGDESALPALAGILREGHARPGSLALEALRAHDVERPERLHAYLAGEQSLATYGRRHLVAAGVPKSRIVFTGYWRAGQAS